MAEAGSWADWVGRVVEGEDSVPAQTAAALAGALDMDAAARAAADIGPDGLLPPLWHWLAFLPDAALSELGPDGRPRRFAMLPPVPLARRRLAGGRLRFHGELRIGETLHRRSEIARVTGDDCGVLVAVAHEISTSRGLAVSETQEFLFQPAGPLAAPAAATPATPDWTDEIAFGPVRLSRFAGATADGHRIHYDAAYARDVEGLSGLVVQGRLQAILLLEAARRRRGGAWPATFAYRSVRPLVAGVPAALMGARESAGGQDLCTIADGEVRMQARVTWEA